MPGDWSRKVSVGDRVELKAEWYNNVTAAAIRDRRSTVDGRPGPPMARRPEGLIPIRNDTGADVDRFQVLGIDSVIVLSPDVSPEQFEAGPVLVGVTPTAAQHRGKFVVTAEAIPKDNIGRAWVFGVCIVAIDFDDVGAVRLDVADGDGSRLTKDGSGIAQVLWSGAGADEEAWAVVRLGGGGGGLPPGLPRQVLQKDDNKNDVFDWVMTP